MLKPSLFLCCFDSIHLFSLVLLGDCNTWLHKFPWAHLEHLVYILHCATHIVVCRQKWSNHVSSLLILPNWLFFFSFHILFKTLHFASITFMLYFLLICLVIIHSSILLLFVTCRAYLHCPVIPSWHWASVHFWRGKIGSVVPE